MKTTIQDFSIRDAARELGCTSQWIRILLWDGRLAGAYKADRQWCIPASAIAARKQQQLERDQVAS
jgi:hypothetical protein